MTNGSLACEGKGFQEGVHRGKGWEVGEGGKGGGCGWSESDLRDGHSLEVAVECREGLHGPCVT